MSYDKEVIDEEVPLYKKALCGDHFFGNIFYPLWRGLDCPCCALWRGIVTGSAITTITIVILETLF